MSHNGNKRAPTLYQRIKNHNATLINKMDESQKKVMYYRESSITGYHRIDYCEMHFVLNCV